MSKKVIVSVKGGLVTAIYSNEDIEVEVFDFDNFDSWQEENELKEYEDSFKQGIKGMKEIY